jgi:integrase
MASLPTKAGSYNFGRNLYLRVSPTGAKSWIFRMRAGGKKVIQLGLGAAGDLRDGGINTDAARVKVIELQKIRLIDGQDVRAERRRRKLGDTFRAVLGRVLKQRAAGWKGGQDGQQRVKWIQSLEDHAGSLLDMRVVQITQSDVLATLKPIWGKEIAGRVQERIEIVLQAAVAEGLIKENVARWKGHLSHLLAAKKKLGENNHKAVPLDDVPGVIARLQGAAGAGAQALLFTILTATRSGETLGALKSEIDREKRLWIIPAERMKAGVEHHVPLSDQAMAIVNARWEQKGDFLFAGKDGTQLSKTALRDKLVKDAKRGGLGIDATTHGFRSCFSDFIGDRTAIDSETREHCLAHQLDAVEGAYRRATAVEKRRAAMQVWANFCFGITSVVTLKLAA